MVIVFLSYPSYPSNVVQLKDLWNYQLFDVAYIYIYIYLRRSAKHQYSFYLAAKELESLKEILMYFLKRLLGGTLEVIRGEREEDKEGKCLFTFNFVVHKRMKLAKTNK